MLSTTSLKKQIPSSLIHPIMKIKIALYSSILVASVFVANLTQAQEKPGKEDREVYYPKQIRIYVEAIEVTALEYADLMTVPTKKNNHSAVRAKLLEKVRKGEAKLLWNQSLVSRSGERATLESVREYLYPTEYEYELGKTLPPKEGDTPQVVAKFPVLPPTPAAFETRNLGYTLEVEPILGEDGKIIDLRFRPESVKHLGESVMADWKTKNAEMKVQVPIFYTMRTNTSVTVIDGEFLLVSTHSPETDGKVDHSRKILQFVRAEALEVKDDK